MTRTRLSFFSALMFLAVSGKAQTDTTVYYFDDDLKECSAKKSVYTAKGWTENDKYGMIYYENATGLPLMRGYYRDKSRKLKDGLFIYYDENGKEGIKGEFVEGKENGYWVSWTKGYLTDSVLYDMGKDLVRTGYIFYENGLLKSRISNDSRNKSTYMLFLDRQGNPERLTDWVNGTGDQTWFYPNGNIKSVERYKNGKQVSIDYFHPDGTQLTKKEAKEKEKETTSLWQKYAEGSPTFPGGDEGFRDQFQRNLKTPAAVDHAIRNAVVIRITFSLDKNGRAVNIKVHDSPTGELDRAVENAFRNMPPWDMKGLSTYGPIQYTISITAN